MPSQRANLFLFFILLLVVISHGQTVLAPGSSKTDVSTGFFTYSITIPATSTPYSVTITARVLSGLQGYVLIGATPTIQTFDFKGTRFYLPPSSKTYYIGVQLTSCPAN